MAQTLRRVTVHMEPFALRVRAPQSSEIYYRSLDHPNAHELTNHIRHPSPAPCLRSPQADGLDEAAMERANDGPAALEVFVSEEAVALPLQKCVQDHRQEQLPYISELKATSLVEIIAMILLI